MKKPLGDYNEAAIGGIIALRNLPSPFFISCFTSLITWSISSSSKIYKMNPFPFFAILFSNLYIAEEADLVANLAKVSLVKGKARSSSVFVSKSVIILPRNYRLIELF